MSKLKKVAVSQTPRAPSLVKIKANLTECASKICNMQLGSARIINGGMQVSLHTLGLHGK